jgi:hypothetical protein
LAPPYGSFTRRSLLADKLGAWPTRLVTASLRNRFAGHQVRLLTLFESGADLLRRL